jgi:predicted GNAT family acetyltransferase
MRSRRDSIPAAPPSVEHNRAAHRFEITDTGETALLSYIESDGRLELIHTETPPNLRRRGYGTRLAHAAFEYARVARLRVMPLCPFVRAYLDRHPEYRSLIDPATTKPTVLPQ